MLSTLPGLQKNWYSCLKSCQSIVVLQQLAIQVSPIAYVVDLNILFSACGLAAIISIFINLAFWKCLWWKLKPMVVHSYYNSAQIAIFLITTATELQATWGGCQFISSWWTITTKTGGELKKGEEKRILFSTSMFLRHSSMTMGVTVTQWNDYTKLLAICYTLSACLVNRHACYDQHMNESGTYYNIMVFVKQCMVLVQRQSL